MAPERERPEQRRAPAIEPQVYEELRAIARRFLSSQPPNHTLQPTALVNEAFLKLAAGGALEPATFLPIAAKAMRQILVDYARARSTAKRGGGAQRITLNEGLTPTSDPDVDILSLHEALEELATIEARKARVVELRFFTGLTIEETAEVLGISQVTVSDDWRFARAWLARRL